MSRPHTSTRPSVRSALTLIALAALVGCGGTDSAPTQDMVAYEGATVIVGDGTVVENAVFLVADDRFSRIGTSDEVPVPEGATRVDLTGKTVIPALVNAHAHLPVDRAARTELLQHMAYYGAGTVVSLGHDEGQVPFEMRDEVLPDGARSLTAGRGITGLEPGRTEVPYWVDSEEEARSAVQELAEREVDIVKIWVDDRNGQYAKLTPELYGAVIDEAHTHGLPVTAHVFSLEDAKGLLRAGIDAFAHGVRDRDIDDELVELWTSRPEVVLVPNLPNPGEPVELDWLGGTVPADRLREMQEGQSVNPRAQESFGIQARNLARLEEAGVAIAFGTDGSTPWAVHLEMEDMVRAGMTPAEVIVAATRNSAALMGLTDVGGVAGGMIADFVVLDANPLDDITNTRAIDAVYLRGTAIDRGALESRLQGGP